jgi:hypothetical protein
MESGHSTIITRINRANAVRFRQRARSPFSLWGIFGPDWVVNGTSLVAEVDRTHRLVYAVSIVDHRVVSLHPLRHQLLPVGRFCLPVAPLINISR